MFGINTEEDFQKFHVENLREIERIKQEFMGAKGLGQIFAKRKANVALKKRVNDKAGTFGLHYNLEGMFMNINNNGFDGRIRQHVDAQGARGI